MILYDVKNNVNFIIYLKKVFKRNLSIRRKVSNSAAEGIYRDRARVRIWFANTLDFYTHKTV